MICTSCEHSIKKSGVPFEKKVGSVIGSGYCEKCGWGFLFDKNGNMTSITCFQAPTYDLAVEYGLIAPTGEVIEGKKVISVKEKQAVETKISQPAKIKQPEVPKIVQPVVEIVEKKIIQAVPSMPTTAAPVNETVVKIVFEVIQKFGAIGKADILTRSGIAEEEYRPAIVVLLLRKQIVQTGQKRGAKYHAA